MAVERDGRENAKTLGDTASFGEGLIVHASGPDIEGIRVTDGHGWTAAGDLNAGASAASATGIPSHHEDLTIETCEIPICRLNGDGGSWGDPLKLHDRTGAGVDAETRDRHDPTRRLSIQVIRAEMDSTFWSGLRHDAQAHLPPGTVAELALNAIRTPWLALPSVVAAFRRLHGADAQQVGFAWVWIVGATETFTERLDITA